MFDKKCTNKCLASKEIFPTIFIPAVADYLCTVMQAIGCRLCGMFDRVFAAGRSGIHSTGPDLFRFWNDICNREFYPGSRRNPRQVDPLLTDLSSSNLCPANHRDVGYAERAQQSFQFCPKITTIRRETIDDLFPPGRLETLCCSHP